MEKPLMLMDMLDGWEMVVLAFGIPAVVGMVVTLRRSSQLGTSYL
jgi:hypothetical protein